MGQDNYYYPKGPNIYSIDESDMATDQVEQLDALLNQYAKGFK